MDSPQNTDPLIRVEVQQKLDNLQFKHQNQEEFKTAQASRRSRKDIEGRDFVCGCGKKYLSYPALYTHIKTKHEGKQPQGTMKYSATAPIKKSKNKLEDDHFNHLVSLVKREDVKLIDLLVPKFVGVTPSSARLKSKILQKQIIDTYHSLIKTTTSPLKLNKQTTLQQHLVAWLIGVGEHVTQKLHDQYQWFARTVKECYYQMGAEVYNKCFSRKDSGLCYIPHFKVEKVKYFPLICDFYIRFFLPYEYNELSINLMELILTDFCHWLNRRKCTFIQIVLNKQYKLITPLKIEQDSKNFKQKGDDDDKCQISQPVAPQSEREQTIRQEKKNHSIPDLDDNPLDNLKSDLSINGNQNHQNIAPRKETVLISANQQENQNAEADQRILQERAQVIEVKGWQINSQRASESSQKSSKEDGGEFNNQHKSIDSHPNEVINEKESNEDIKQQNKQM